MSQSLPEAILAQLTALGTAMVQQAQQQRGAPRDTLEAGVRQAMQAALPGLLGAVVHLATPDRDPAIATVHRRCPRCDRRVAPLEPRDRTVRTTCGRLTCTRPWYHGARCQHGFSPVDAARGLPPRARSSPAPAPGSCASPSPRRPPRRRRCAPSSPGWWCIPLPGARTPPRWGRRWPTPRMPPARRCRRRGRRRSRWTPPPARWWSRPMGRWCATWTAGMR